MAKEMVTTDEHKMLARLFNNNSRAGRRGNQDLGINVPGPKTFLADFLGSQRKGGHHLEGHARALLATSHQ